MKNKKRIVWLSILTSLISIPTIFSFNSLRSNNYTQSLTNNTLSTRSAKTIDPSIENLYASEIATELKTIFERSKPGNDQTELKDYLKKLFPTEMGTIKPDATIDNVVVRANSTLGSLYVAFGVYEDNVGNLIQVNQYANNFKLNNKGTTKINLVEYNDSKITYDEIRNKLVDKDISYLVDNGILVNVAKNSTIKVLDFVENSNPKRFVITNLLVENAIGVDRLENYAYNESVVITNLPQDIKTTSLVVKLDYLNDPAFKDLTTLDKFVDYLNTNKTDANVIEKLVNVVHPTTSPDTVIKIKTAVANQNKQYVKVTYTITNYFNEYGELIPNEKDFDLIYTSLPINRLVTLVSFENLLEEVDKDYAYQYSQDDIQKIIDDDIKNKTNKIIINPRDDTTAKVYSYTVNNRTATVKINLTLNNIYDANGNLLDASNFTDIKFIAKKTITAATNVVRNKDVVQETIKEIDAMNDNDKKTWATKYIDVVNKSDNPATGILVESVEKQKKYNTYASSGIVTSSVYVAKVSLTNYFKYNPTFEFDSNSSGPIFNVYINAKMNRPTNVIDTVEANGINATDPIDKITAVEVVNNINGAQDKTKEWIINNFDKIFENYTSTTITNANIVDAIKYEASGDRDVKVTLTLKDAIDFDILRDIEFSFIIKNFQQEQELTVPKTETDVSANQVNGIDSNIYAIDVANDRNNLKNTIINAINDSNNINLFFDHAPSEEQRKDDAGTARPIVKDDNLDLFYNNTTLKIKGYFLANTQKNPNLKAEYKEMTLTLINFNNNNTDNVKHDIDITNDPILSKKTINQVTYNDLYDYVEKNSSTLFTNLPLSATFERTAIINKHSDSVSMEIKINNAKINKNDHNDGYGLVTFTFNFKGFLTPVSQIVGKTLTVDEARAAGLIALDNNVYSIDFESKFHAQLNDVLYENMDKWFNNTIMNGINLKDKIKKQDFSSDLSYTYEYNSVTITGRFLGWNESSLNPNDEPTKITTRITINNFKDVVTTNKNRVDVSNIDELKNLSVDDKNINAAIKTFIEKNKVQVFDNYPEAMQIDSVSTNNPNVPKGEIIVSIYVRNAMVQDSLGIKKYANNSFHQILFTGFFAKIEPTRGNTLTVMQANTAGVQVNNNSYAFDFEQDHKQQFIDSIKKEPSGWLINLPDAQKIQDSGLNILDEASLEFESVIENNRPVVKIKGKFISWNESGNSRDPLVLKEQTITITGFNYNNTSFNASIDIKDKIPGLNTQDFSTTDAADYLNKNKNLMKDYLNTSINSIISATSGKTSTFEQTLKDAVNNENFEVKVENGNLILILNGIDKATNNGVEKVRGELEMFIATRFNPTTLNTELVINSVGWAENLFNTIFKDKSKFAFDWKDDFWKNNVDSINDQLKQYMINNISKFFRVSNYVNFDWTQKIKIKNVRIQDDSFKTDINNSTAQLVIEYQGYINGTLTDTTALFNINLRSTPSEQEIINKLQEVLDKDFSNKYPINDNNFDSFIDDMGQKIKDTIQQTLKELLPEKLMVEFNDNGDAKNLFEPTKNENGQYSIIFKKDSITIKPKDDVSNELKAQYQPLLLPGTNHNLIIETLTPKSWWFDWMIYVVIFSTIVLLILVVMIYEYYLSKRRRKSEINLG